MTSGRCKEVVAVLPCPGLGEMGQPWSILQSLPVRPALLSSPAGGGTRKEGVECWMSSSRGILALPVFRVGAEAFTGFREVACIQHTTLSHPANSILLRGCQWKKKDIFFGVDLMLTGQTSLKGTYRRNAYEYVSQC